jgi:Ca2+-binding RTX toxin-like protein
VRRTILLLASISLAVLLACGVALAATVDCVAGEVSCVGTKNDDTLNGSDERDEMYGSGGDDLLLGNGGDDELLGYRGKDTIRGGEGEDTVYYQDQGVDKIYGGGRDDELTDASVHCTGTSHSWRCFDDENLLRGGRGDDYLSGNTKLFGGPGDDELYVSYPYKGTRTILDGGPGLDTIEGAGSVDTIYAQDGEQDEISCGGDKDTVYFDKGIDSVNSINCERRISEPQ